MSYPLKGSNYSNFVFCIEKNKWTEVGWSIESEPYEILMDFKEFKVLEPIIPQLVGIKKWGLFGCSSNEKWTSGNLALLGDSCHPMLPFLAQGANQALEDAHFVAKSLSGSSIARVADRLKIYSESRKKRVVRVQLASQLNARIYHTKNPILKLFLHNYLNIISKIAPNLLLSRFDWLYGYNPK